MSNSEQRQKLQAALTLHQAGELDKAAELYRQIIARDPNDCYALHYLGLIEAARGNYPQAAALLRRSLSTIPANSQFVENYATVLLQAQDYQLALGAAEDGLAANKSNIALLYIGAVSLFKLQRYNEAVNQFDKLLSLTPDHATALNERGAALAAMEEYEAALSSFAKALARQPRYAEAHVNAGRALSALKRYEDALAAYDKALAIKPELVDAWIGRGTLLMRMKRPVDALTAYDRALALRADSADAWLGRGNACNELSDYANALSAFDKALMTKPDLANAWLGRGNTFSSLAQYDAALAAYDNALKLEPDLAGAWFGRGVSLAVHGRDDEALVAFDEAVTLRLDLDYAFGARLFTRLTLCDWTDLESETVQLSAMIDRGVLACTPFQSLALFSSPAAQWRCASVVSQSRPGFASMLRGRICAHERIRVAYLSADLRDHAVGFLTAGLFEHHDRSRFEVMALSLGPDQPSLVRDRIRAGVEHFVDIHGWSERQIAELIYQREIDVLVDLMGQTRHNRLGVLARRPAPIQVSYLGYSGTTGADFIDYILADATVIPEDHREFYTEQVVWLPDCYLVNDDRRAIAERVPSRRECRLPEDGFVFCCFNNPYKFAPEMFRVWMRLLQAVPGAVLWLAEPNPTAQDNLRRAAVELGVAAERVVFAPQTPSVADHLARLRQADLFLDTLPYNAHTTAADALWAGLPLLTCLGSTFVGRVAASLLKAVGLDELITQSPKDYEALALKLARDSSYLSSLRGRLAQNREIFPLFDTARTTRNIEAAYTMMWERHQRGERAKPRTGQERPIQIA